jgi:quercetin dioxygenase-like cupin family protein
MQNEARAERHGHPGGEEAFLLSGSLRIDRRVGADNQPLPDVVLSAGDYFYAETGEVHEAVAEEEGTTYLVIAPRGIGRGSG